MPTDAEPPPLILTLELDDASFGWLDALRQAHFPPERNYLNAHLTLFHKLPGDEVDAISDTLDETTQQFPPLDLTFSELMFLGGGVAVRVESEALLTVRKRLAKQWSDWLTRQDQQGFRPHVTVQNKVSAETARALLADLEADWTVREGTGAGLSLWKYLGGPWEHVSDHPFTG